MEIAGIQRVTNRHKRGFTLIELVIVLIVLGILALIAVPRFIDLRDEATVAVRSANSATLHSSLMLYRAEHSGEAPTVRQLADMITGNNRPTVKGGALWFDSGDGKKYGMVHNRPVFTNSRQASLHHNAQCLDYRSAYKDIISIIF
ncbi:MAG: prepilin-type N-terminal cleavage/methylation domain-containing protein [Gammaproteobacteria bacterium]|nr:prepilin-type N-terminal cleavage/methylation domain-containing protein [Gammaproteobacteria bacterium]